jgi:hypothetical protein
VRRSEHIRCVLIVFVSRQEIAGLLGLLVFFVGNENLLAKGRNEHRAIVRTESRVCSPHAVVIPFDPELSPPCSDGRFPLSGSDSLVCAMGLRLIHGSEYVSEEFNRAVGTRKSNTELTTRNRREAKAGKASAPGSAPRGNQLSAKGALSSLEAPGHRTAFGSTIDEGLDVLLLLRLPRPVKEWNIKPGGELKVENKLRPGGAHMPLAVRQLRVGAEPGDLGSPRSKGMKERSGPGPGLAEVA